MKVAVLFSGGVDSTAALLSAHAEGHLITPLFINYGQRNMKSEERAVAAISRQFKLEYVPIFVGGVKFDMWGSDVLTNNPLLANNAPMTEEVPILPGRNLLLVAIGASYCQAHGIDALYTGFHLSSAVPDSSPEFNIACANACIAYNVMLRSPALTLTKPEIIDYVRGLGVYDMTWSCYEGGITPCGKCAACRSRNG
jgi:7-cyano-7-deazaguanine synthase